MHNTNLYILTTLFIITLVACKHQSAHSVKYESNFPEDVGKIIQTNCAVAGCHNATSYSAAGGLLLDTWEHLFDGSTNGAVVIPYSPDFSSFLYFINNDESRGIVALPTMPVNRTPLTPDEYNTIKNWIANGAPDVNGNIPFAERSDTRQKIYTIQQECDVMAVIDVEKNVVMRYMQLGKEAYPEIMSDIAFSKDGKYAYLCYWFSSFIQKIDVNGDSVIAEFNTGNSFWSTLTLSEDGNKVIITNEDDNTIKVLDATSLQEISTYTFDMVRPRGVISSPNAKTIYAASRLGNTIYKIADNKLKKISIDGNPITTSTTSNGPNPWDLLMSLNNDKYFVSCAQTNDIRVINAITDTIIKIIPVGSQPQEMAISKNAPYLFVTCMEDNSSAERSKGSVYVINYNTLEVVRRIEGKLYEPFGITVNDNSNTFYVFSKNLTADGPAPHHGSPCNGRNGFYQIFDITSLAPINNKRYEILVNPGVAKNRF